jgi:hypothetical protein
MLSFFLLPHGIPLLSVGEAVTRERYSRGKEEGGSKVMTKLSGSMNFLIIFPNGKKGEILVAVQTEKGTCHTLTDMLRENLNIIPDRFE